MFTCVLALLALGCTYSHTVTTTQRALQIVNLKTEYRVQRQAPWAIPRASTVFLNYPSGPAGAPQALPRLRHALAEPWYQQAQWRFSHVAMAPMDASRTELFRMARAGHFEFVLQLTVVQTFDDPQAPTTITPGLYESARQSTHGERLILLIEVFDTHSEARLDTLAVAGERPFWVGSPSADAELISASLEALLVPLTGPRITRVN